MKRAVIISSFVPKDNASPAVVNTKMLYLASNTFESVSFITSGFPLEAASSFENIQLINIGTPFEFAGSLKKLCNYIFIQLKILRLIKNYDRQQTIFMFWLSGPMLVPFLYCKYKQYKTVCFLYGNSKYKEDRATLFNSLKAAIMKYMGLKAEYLCVEALSVADQWGIDLSKHKLYKVHLYVDTEVFKPIIPYESRENIIGMCCRLVPSKRVLEAIKAFSIFRSSFKDFKLHIAGSGQLFSKCQKLIHELGENENITLLGWVDNSKMPQLYNRWKLLLNPTNYEGLPNSLLESMACGTPALSSGVGGVPEVVWEHETGWILEDCSPHTIANRLSHIFDKEDLQGASVRARGLIVKEYDKRVSLDKFKAFTCRIQ